MLFKSVLDRQEKTLGSEHPDTLMCANNLALVCWDQGRLDLAEETMRSVIEINRKVLGQSHSHTLKITTGSARILKDQKQYDDSLVLYRRAILGLRKALGSDHPYNIKLSNEFEKLEEEMGTNLQSKTSISGTHLNFPPSQALGSETSVCMKPPKTNSK